MRGRGRVSVGDGVGKAPLAFSPRRAKVVPTSTTMPSPPFCGSLPAVLKSSASPVTKIFVPGYRFASNDPYTPIGFVISSSTRAALVLFHYLHGVGGEGLYVKLGSFGYFQLSHKHDSVSSTPPWPLSPPKARWASALSLIPLTLAARSYRTSRHGLEAYNFRPLPASFLIRHLSPEPTRRIHSSRCAHGI